ncbi:MAG: DNA-3-methyladenine glycosylase [Clostridiales bacterium]|nr:DNA-3-methyladenine glycosylase [Clostridiales bacterium]
MIIPRAFYERDTLTVARELLGQILVRRTEEGETRGIIVETEAYLGEKDDAAHSYKGKSDRVRVQYGPAGMAYIYMIYGMYNCLNITSGPPGVPEAILIRALEPVSGIGLMKDSRRTDKLTQLCSGPGKLCMAMDIDKTLYGADLCQAGPVYLEYGQVPAETEASKRIGIDYAALCRDKPWRFTIPGNPHVSVPRRIK